MGLWNGVSIVFGVVVLAYVILSYEDEERSASRWLEATWVRLANADKSLSVRLHALLQVLVARSEEIISNVFGRQLLSVRLVLCSIGLSGLFQLASANWYTATIVFLVLAIAYRFEWIKRLLVGAFLYVVTMILVPIPLLGVVGIEYMNWVLIVGARNKLDAPFVALVIDVASLVAVRLIARRVAKTQRLRHSALLASGGALVTPALLIAFGPGLGGDPQLWFIVQVLCAPALLASWLFVFILFLLVLYRLGAALLPRFAYSFIKLRVLENRKVMASVGALLIAVGSPTGVPTIEKLVKAVVA